MSKLVFSDIALGVTAEDFLLAEDVLLLKSNSKVNINLRNMMEMPLYIVALARWPPIDVQMLRHTIPVNPVPVDQLYYKGKNIIFCCIDYNIDMNVFEEVLRRCSTHVLTQRIKDNLDTRLYAIRAEKFEFVDIIDKRLYATCQLYWWSKMPGAPPQFCMAPG